MKTKINVALTGGAKDANGKSIVRSALVSVLEKHFGIRIVPHYAPMDLLVCSRMGTRKWDEAIKKNVPMATYSEFLDSLGLDAEKVYKLYEPVNLEELIAA